MKCHPVLTIYHTCFGHSDLNEQCPSKAWIIKAIHVFTCGSSSGLFQVSQAYLNDERPECPGAWWLSPYLLLCLDFSRSFSLSFLCSLCRCSRSLCLSLCLWESATIRDKSVTRSHVLSPAHLPWWAGQEAQWQDLNGMVAIYNSIFHWRKRLHKPAQTRHPITLPLKPRYVKNKHEEKGEPILL